MEHIALLDADADSLPALIEAIQTQNGLVKIVAHGRNVSKACYLAAIGIDQWGYVQQSVKISRVQRGPADLSRISIALKRCIGEAGPVST